MRRMVVILPCNFYRTVFSRVVQVQGAYDEFCVCVAYLARTRVVQGCCPCPGREHARSAGVFAATVV